ncbi:DM13 domain-containing protein [Jannaschia ovalis]|uniref:DM13 domain-containing protein n=1 Tax=Jannaschia ovalis TaxID=3038773 RepID=A0ABY8LGK8_9RHOB|nr:DM13 domain-containing protein [Jannaschia sp. GRR-S6-38]WGH80281.1 DM13 domain-containing protein [Jannaschia sp. GRR-S6-38]
MHRRTFLASAAALAASPALAGGHGRLGSFTGASGHATNGTAEIADGRVNLLADFRFDGAPDPKVALGRDGYDPATLMGPLAADSGASSYALPAGVDPADYNEVWIWCERFNVPLGVARLN